MKNANWLGLSVAVTAALTSAATAYEAATPEKSVPAGYERVVEQLVRDAKTAARARKRPADEVEKWGEEARGNVPLAINWARSYEVDPLLVLAIIKRESAFQSWIVSGTSDRGLMQINPVTASYWLCDKRPCSPQVLASLHERWRNLDVGIKHLKLGFRLFARTADLKDVSGALDRADVRSAIAAYGAGIGAVRKAGGVPPGKAAADVEKAVAYYKQLKPLVGSPAWKDAVKAPAIGCPSAR